LKGHGRLWTPANGGVFHGGEIRNITKTTSLLWKRRNDDIKKEEDFTSSPLCSRAEVDKVFRIIRDAANDQIPASGPGIVIIYSPQALDWHEFELIAEKRFQGRKKYPALSAVILIQRLFQDGQLCHNSHIVFNPQASTDLKSSAVLKLFSNTKKQEG